METMQRRSFMVMLDTPRKGHAFLFEGQLLPKTSLHRFSDFNTVITRTWIYHSSRQLLDPYVPSIGPPALRSLVAVSEPAHQPY